MVCIEHFLRILCVPDRVGKIPHILSGKILPGKQLGRKLGFPTANMALPAGVLTPKRGVYICKASIDGVIYSALTNIGCRPTVNGNGILAETHLLDFDQDLYEQDMIKSK